MKRTAAFAIAWLLASACTGNRSSGITCPAAGASAVTAQHEPNGSGGTSNSSDGAVQAAAPPFPSGTVCNASGIPRTPPVTIAHLIVVLFENENVDAVIGSRLAPYISSLASQCAVATAYQDDVFSGNLVSLPHYLALTSGSNCSTGLERTGNGCITSDADALVQTLATPSIFSQVASWRSYQEDMPKACSALSGRRYAAKHNPAAYYRSLSSCALNDLSIAALQCDPCTTNTPCSPERPSNAFTADLEADTLAQFTFITPTLDNDMHDGTVTQADNWVRTYLPLIFASRPYLRGEVVVQLLWDEQTTSTFGGPIPNVFISPYVGAGTTSSIPINHFAVLRSWEKAFGIVDYLGCASGTPPGGAGTCPADSTADVRAALGW